MGSFWSHAEDNDEIKEITKPLEDTAPQLDNKLIEAIKQAEEIRTDILDELKHNSSFRDRRAKSLAKE
jgi:hypothetical protein